MPLAAERVVNGTHGKLYIGSVWIANVQRLEARIAVERREVRVAGTRHTGYKAMNVSGEGTIAGLKVTSFWLKLISRYMRQNNSRVPVLTLSYVLDDPDNGGQEIIDLTRCQFWEVPFGYQVGEILEESIPFTFENMNIRSCLSDDWEGYTETSGVNDCGEVTI